jgi:hypothetical protein
MTFSDLPVLLLALLASVCFIIFLVSVWSRGGFGGLRPAGLPPPAETPMPSLRAAVWLMIPVGAVLLGIGLRRASDEVKTLRWNVTEGKILESRVDAVKETRVDLFRRRIPMRRYLPVVRFRHDGRTGDRIRLRQGSVPWRFWAEWIVDGWEPGGNAKVYVDPEDPSRAVLRRGPSPFTIVCLVAGGFLCFLVVRMF